MIQKILIAVICLSFISSKPIERFADDPKVQILSQVKTISSKYPSASVSFNLSDPQTGKNIVSYNPGTALVPASNTKAITTAAAIQILGIDYRFTTILGLTGSVDGKGVLNGNIEIVGSGDPTLGTDRIPGNHTLDVLINNWVKAIKDKGIKEVSGNIIADNGSFPRNTIPDGWIWTDIGNYYGAGSSGININENLYRIYFKPGKEPGFPTEILRVEPEVPGLTFINDMKTGPKGSGDNGYIYGGNFSFQKYLKGTIPAGVNEFSIKGSIPDPGLFFAQVIKKELEKNGVKVTGDATVQWGVEKPLPKPIIIHESPQLSDIIKYTNQYSINLYAEAILNILGKGKGTESGITAVKDFLAMKGVDTQALFMIDGSGLSPQNGISSNTFTQVLDLMANSDKFPVYLASLPVAGQSGTLSGLCKGTAAEGRIYAKSGSFERVLGYTGYIKSKSGKYYSFSILVNNYTGKSYQLRKEIEELFVQMAAL